jgi:hypothetical protein
MRRLTWIGIAALLALVAAGIAVAHGRGAKGTDPVSATFTATATRTDTKTCTGPDGTYNIVHAKYEGTSTGDPRLTGRITLRTRSVINTTTGYGFTKGSLVVRNGEGRRLASAHLVGVNSAQTTVNGFAAGRTRGVSDAAPGGSLLANLTTTLSGNVLSGRLGTNGSQNTAIVFSGACNRERDRD